jgi:cobalt-zinc-cadmium efflux system outer membrane protein
MRPMFQLRRNLRRFFAIFTAATLLWSVGAEACSTGSTTNRATPPPSATRRRRSSAPAAPAEHDKGCHACHHLQAHLAPAVLVPALRWRPKPAPPAIARHDSADLVPPASPHDPGSAGVLQPPAPPASGLSFAPVARGRRVASRYHVKDRHGSNRAARLAVCLLIGGCRAAALAAEEPQGELTCARGSRSRSSATQLAAFSQEIRPRRPQSSRPTLPNPKLDVVGDNLGNTRKKEDGDRSASLLIGQLVELGGKRAARVRLAETGRDLAGWDYEAKRLEIFARVRQTFVEVLTAQGRTGLADESVRLAQAVADGVAKRVQAGKVPPVEETKARLTVSAALIEREQARRELAAARNRLAAPGEPRAALGRAAGDLERAPPLPAFETLAARIRDNPELARWATEIQRRQAGVEAERAKAVPDITVSGGISRFTVYNDNAYLVGISIPIPVFDQNRGGILEANRRLDKAADERRAVEPSPPPSCRTPAAPPRSRIEIETLRTDLLPCPQQRVRRGTQGYQLGKFGFLDARRAAHAVPEPRAIPPRARRLPARRERDRAAHRRGARWRRDAGKEGP